MQVETLSKTDQVKEQLGLLKAQRETLLQDLNCQQQGSQAFADVAQRLVSLNVSIQTQEQALQFETEAAKTESERQAEAERARQAEAEAAAQALTAAKLERDELLKSWASLAAQLKAAIVSWNEFAATDQAALLRQQNAYPNAAGSYSSENWDRLVPYTKQRPDGGWTLFLNRDFER